MDKASLDPPYDPDVEGGRAPDTYARLAAAGAKSTHSKSTKAPKKQPKKQRRKKDGESHENPGVTPPSQSKPGSSDPEPLLVRQQKRLLRSYAWQAPNSCFFDTGLELWFRAYMMMTKGSQSARLCARAARRVPLDCIGDILTPVRPRRLLAPATLVS
ncbi:hypothetical protein C8J56DRAFT_1040299 [Mycena floridula]|nr:hypothetical protein C8J56DRAFT_1040299 [Mycena floridula]